MPITDAALNAEELQYLSNVVMEGKVLDNDVTKLDQIESPLHKLMMSKAQKSGQPPNGDFVAYVSGNREQKITWWDGRDILPFDSQETTMKMTFRIGRGHYGAEFLLDLMARAGVNVDYSTGIRQGGGSARAQAAEVAVRVIEDHWKDISYNFMNEMRKTIIHSNIAQPKAFTGIAGLLTPTTTFTGTIGGLPRSNPLLQHNVITGITIDNFMLNYQRAYRRCTRRTKTKPHAVVLGDEFYDLVADLFFGTSTRTGKADFQMAQAKALKAGEKFGFAPSQNMFMAPDGQLFILEPTFEELDDEFAPSVRYSKQMWILNLDHLRLVPVKEQTIDHGVPYNKRVSRTSFHGEYGLVLDHPKSCAVLVLA